MRRGKKMLAIFSTMVMSASIATADDRILESKSPFDSASTSRSSRHLRIIRDGSRFRSLVRMQLSKSSQQNTGRLTKNVSHRFQIITRNCLARNVLIADWITKQKQRLPRQASLSSSRLVILNHKVEKNSTTSKHSIQNSQTSRILFMLNFSRVTRNLPKARFSRSVQGTHVKTSSVCQRSSVNQLHRLPAFPFPGFRIERLWKTSII